MLMKCVYCKGKYMTSGGSVCQVEDLVRGQRKVLRTRMARRLFLSSRVKANEGQWNMTA